ncbi:MAG: thioredoxin domain-containing protein, partial [Chloroflexales bacterium]
LLRVTEATFGRRVLRAPLPVLVCFGTQRCPGRQALAPALERIAATYQGRLRVATVLVDDAILLGEQDGVVASPTLLVFQHGDRQGQAIGFIPAGLVDLLADDVVQGVVTGDILWSPVEEQFEDRVLLPLLQRWGCTAQRQVACALPGRGAAQRGRIDLLVYADPADPPFTLIESKRHMRGDQALRQAVAQATAYARSLALASFVIAAPPGLWIYRIASERPVCIQQVTSLEIHQAPDRAQAIFLQLR